MTKAVVFDVGGVLAQDVWEHFFRDEGGITKKYRLDRGQLDVAGSLLWEIFAYRPASHPIDPDKFEKEYWDLFIKVFRLKKSARGDLIKRSHKFIRAVEGMVALLEKLKRHGIDLLICSNNNEFWFKRQMDDLGFHRFFKNPDKIILSCRVGVSKSDPSGRMYQAVRNALDRGVRHCVFVDDREGNIKRALDAGLTGILFPQDAKCGARYVETLLKKMGFFR